MSFRKLNIAIMTLTVASLLTPASYAKSKKSSTHGDSGLSSLKYKNNDETGNDKKALAAELLIAAQEQKAMDQIHLLIRKYKNTELEADLLMRLAELHMRRAKTERFLEGHRSEGLALGFSPKIVKNAASKKQVMAAIQLFDQIEKRFPRFDKIDTVVFNNAFANQQINNHKNAEKKFLKLINDFPNSILLPDAHLALGEIQFSNKQFKKALTHFTAIRKYPDSLVYPYGIYKAGWTHYNMRDADAGLKELEDVIRYGKFVKEQGIDARLDLRKEALIDMALFYEDVRSAKDAFKYFDSQSADLDVSPSILKLSSLYKRHSRHSDMRIVLTEYLKRMPTSNYIPVAYVELMEASEKLKKRRDVVTLLGNFNALCEPSSSWSKAQSKEPEQLKECQKLFNQMALGYANKWLKLWQADANQIELADSAEKAFSLYLKADATSEDSNKARFVYGELLFKREKYRDASEQYAITAKQTQDKKIGHDARYYAIISLEKAVKDKWSDKDENTFKYLANDYLTQTKDGRYKLDILFKVAFIAYEKGRYDEAAPTFYKLGSDYAKIEKGIKSQDLYLDILNIKKDYVSLRDYSNQLRKSVSGERAETLTKVYEESYFFIIQNLEAKGQYAEAIKEYQTFAKVNPTSKLTQKALWNSTQLHYKSGDLMAGAQSAVAYYEKYPNTKEGLDALMKAAQTYESLGQLSEAAQVLVTLAHVDKAQKTKWTTLAADFYALSNNFKKARPLYESVKGDASTPSGFRALEQLEYMARQDNKVKEREILLKEIIKTGRQPQASLASVYFVEQAYDNKEYEEAFNSAKKIISLENAGASKNALARARLTQARVLEREFRNQSVKSRLDKVQMVLTLKTEKLSKAQVAYQSAAKYGDPLVAVKAYSALADCYLHYNEALRSMPIPTGIPEEEAQAFRSEMDKLAIPMEEKGIETKLQAFSVAKELGVHDQIVLDLQEEMKKLNQQVVKEVGVVKLQPAHIVLPNLDGVGS
ncbi:MAG: tetratricopeptide repeat protein [Bdellovibrionales bacterium]|nr:tetratricopeptide repeat protein [Bdellovibrionales bacterium]